MQFKIKYLLLYGVGLLIGLPIIFLVVLSLSTTWVFPIVLPKGITVTHWVGLFKGNSNIQLGFIYSLGIALIVAFIAVIIGFFLAKFVMYNKYSKLLINIIYCPFVLSPVIFAVCIRYYFLNLHLVGNLVGVIIAQLLVAVPYSILFFTSFFNAKVKAYYQLVSTLGGSSFIAFKNIILPLAKSFIQLCFFQCFLLSWFEFGLTTIIGYGKIKTLTINVFQYISEANIFEAALSCCVLILPPIVLLWINKKVALKQTH